MSRLKRMLVLALSIAMVGLFGLVTGGTTASAQPPGVGKKNVVQVQGTGPNGAKFNGQFVATAAKEVTKAEGAATSDQNGATSSNTGVALTGQLIGKLVTPGGGQPAGAPGAAQDVNMQNFAMPVNAINFPPSAKPSSSTPGDSHIQFASQQASCSVLDLTLGPLDLNLLGLRVQLNQVHLVITAIPADGLLGQLLCSLAGPNGVLSGAVQNIVNLLNQILGQL
ncbi:hypothetical protein Mycch_3796 [Mycolicibacterium chubuense NBB4]|uniref:ABC transporter substrate-binding protein n=1 Tax=Mycolicibacterium chubuense (strain NBB4) TaxID=710421 RepID=I4BML5_MYCCN|nr:hypothetical protein [Mycolicibacterium chubuense]AFM18522.1 hypothetical protein Mycch_3796 [Mycolicibacterium chubuense NBB4]